MRARWQIAIALVVVLGALLAVNTVVVDTETGAASPTAEGAEILELPGGDLQVLDEGPTEAPEGEAGPPIVLIHGTASSLHWFDRLAPRLAERHRVVRIDLLGHGGSEKPSSGYSVAEQSALVAAALSQLDVSAAVVVGHSMGFTITVALAEQASELVDRMVNIGSGPSSDSCSLPLRARLLGAPVLGQTLWRLSPDFAVRSGYDSAFASGFEIEAGFDDPDQVVDDYRALTHTSYTESRSAIDDYREEMPLDARARASAVPLLSIFGAEDDICDPVESQAAYQTVPGSRTETLVGIGHSPNVEVPGQTAQLIERFADGG